MAKFTAVYPISNENVRALPVRQVERAFQFFRNALGFEVSASDEQSATLERDGVAIGLVCKEDHMPGEAGSCYFAVDDVDALRQEFESRGLKPGAIEVQSHDKKLFRIFFVRECDYWEPNDGYCFCFGQPA